MPGQQKLKPSYDVRPGSTLPGSAYPLEVAGVERLIHVEGHNVAARTLVVAVEGHDVADNDGAHDALRQTQPDVTCSATGHAGREGVRLADDAT
jgi:hypothetical protein